MNKETRPRILSALLAVVVVCMAVASAVDATPICTGNSDVSSVYRATDFSNPIALRDLKEMREKVLNPRLFAQQVYK